MSITNRLHWSCRGLVCSESFSVGSHLKQLDCHRVGGGFVTRSAGDSAPSQTVLGEVTRATCTGV